MSAGETPGHLQWFKLADLIRQKIENGAGARRRPLRHRCGRRDAATSRQPWNECIACVSHDLPLAATVVMGGILEAFSLPALTSFPTSRPCSKPSLRLRARQQAQY
jgi:hypothetical protein